MGKTKSVSPPVIHVYINYTLNIMVSVGVINNDLLSNQITNVLEQKRGTEF